MNKFSFNKYIQNEAINLPKGGKALFDPSAKAEIEQSTYEIESILPDMSPKGKRYLELMIEGTYAELLDRIKKYTNTPTPDRLSIMTALVQSLDTIHKIEKNHINHLENLAIQTVLELDEYKFIKDMVREKRVTFNVKILQPNLRKAFDDFNQRVLEDSRAATAEELTPGENFELNAIDILMEADASKAAFADYIHEGEAANSFEMFKLCKENLDKIDTRLIKLYELYAVAAHVGYYMVPFHDMNGAIDAAAGMANVTPQANGPGSDDDGYLITAHGINFATLIYEIVKGVYKYIGLHSKDQQTLDKADINDERLPIMGGAKIAENFKRAILNVIGYDNINYIQPLYAKLYSNEVMPDDIKDILNGTPESKQLIKQLFDEVKDEQDQRDAADQETD